MTMLVATAVVTGAAWLFAQTSAHGHHRAPSQTNKPAGSSPTPVAAPVAATGTIVYGRMLTVGDLTDVADGLYRTPPEGVSTRVTEHQVCCLSASPSTGRIAYSTTRDARATTYDLTTKLHTFTIPADLSKLVPTALSTNAKSVAFEGWDIKTSSIGVYTQPTRGGTLRQLTKAPTPQIDRPLAFSPDNSHVLFFRGDRLDDRGALYAVNADGGRAVRLSPPGTEVLCCFFGSPASWSPDGRRVAFSGYPNPRAESPHPVSGTYVVDRDGSHLHRITDRTFNSTSSHWSPNGIWIVYDTENHPNHHHDLFLVHPDGTGGRTIDTDAAAGGSCCAQWSPNSKSLVFEHGPADDDINLYTVNIDGSGPPRQITHGRGGYFSFAWLR